MLLSGRLSTLAKMLDFCRSFSFSSFSYFYSYLREMLTIWRSLEPVGEVIFLGLARMS